MEVEAINCNYAGDDCYFARVIPVIFDISATEGYVAGGQELTVTGSGFNFGDVVVDIDGYSCEILSKTNEEFVCATGEADDVSTTDTDTIGGYGVKWIFYNDTYTMSESTISTNGLEPQSTELLTAFETPTNFEDYYSSYLRGWFVAPKTGNYRFYIACDDYCNFKMGVNDPGVFNSDDLTTVVSNSGWVNTRQYWYPLWTDYSYDRFMSQWIALEEGENYYVEGFHYEGSGGDNFAVSVEIEEDDSSAHPNAMKEIQRLSMIPDQTYEKMWVKIQNADSNSYRLKLTNPDDGEVFTSESIAADATNWVFRSYIRRYFIWNKGTDIDVTKISIDADGVETDDADLIDAYLYEITLRELQAADSVSVITVQRVSTSATITTYLPSEVQQSSPPMTGKFKILCYNEDGESAYTESLSAGASTSNILSALN